MIKAIFFDIDGTLVSFKTHKIPQSTLDVISELKRKGIKLFIATGRPFMAINNLNGLEFDGYITLNGGCCLNKEKGIIHKNVINPEDIKSLVKFQEEEYAFPCVFVNDDRMFINFVNENVLEVLKLVDFPELAIENIRKATEKDVLQMMAFINEEHENKIFSEVLVNCQPARWNPLFTDIISLNSSKKVGMQKILDYYNISVNDTMAFGDGGNDIPMLDYANYGIAMGNANEDVKQMADYVTDPVDENGVINALKYFKVI